MELLQTLPEWILMAAALVLVLLIVILVALLITAFIQKRHIKISSFEIGSVTNSDSERTSDNPSAQQSSEYTDLLDKISFLLNIKSNLQPFRKEIVRRALTSAHDEINRIISGANYEVDIGVESNFLLRAKPLFENADEIYAITLNTVSSFWVDKGSKALAREYLRSQPPKTKRLFVFDSSESFRLYRNTITDHYAQYGYKGAVLITSKPNYSKFLANVLSSEEIHLQYHKKDFGLLHYKDHWLLAELDSNHLTFEPVPELASFRLDAEKMKSLFEEFANIGENCKVVNDISVIKWMPSVGEEAAESFLFSGKNA